MCACCSSMCFGLHTVQACLQDVNQTLLFGSSRDESHVARSLARGNQNVRKSKMNSWGSWSSDDVAYPAAFILMTHAECWCVIHTMSRVIALTLPYLGRSLRPWSCGICPFSGEEEKILFILQDRTLSLGKYCPG